ncbi:MAG TPA: hypothetical protein VFH01_09990 [Pyrinomonadaceae bacterium]|nr:hypothetical protein [Pyrinomonadaceae bacterium]
MKLGSLAISPLVFSVAIVVANAQSQPVSEMTRPRTVSSPAPQAEKTQELQQQLPAPVQSSEPQPVRSPSTVPPKSVELAGTEAETESKTTSQLLSPQAIRTRIAEAERLFKSRPKPTSLAPSIQFVTLAALEPGTPRIHHITLLKETFLTKGSEFSTTSSLGVPLNVRVLRANGVNTAVTVFDNQGRSLTPLLVEFPIEKRGVFRELAYYTSAHPALLSPDLSRSGQLYIRNMLDLAAKRLREKGVFISPQIIDVAERLCLVEHVDHERFRQENRAALFQEVYSLFALNEINTYRYSVSSAGAGGMVQMIPWAYNLMRQRHPAVGLMPDFVTGMRNHGNALQAMLLYMQDTWNDLAANDEVQYALNAKLATQQELLAAGYNSNAARLPGYLKRGGASWRVLIPRETQMYLQIYKNFEALVPIKPRPTQIPSVSTSGGS